jgi:putative transposase
MSRFARVVMPQCPHHVTQRGNERRYVFFTTADREVYLGLLKQYSELYAVEVLRYCLMTNHVFRVLAVPPKALTRCGKVITM